VLAGTIVIPGAQAGPGGEMAVAREPIHVDTDLGYEDFRCTLIDTGNGIEALHRVREGRQDRRDTLAQRGHRLFEMVEMGQDLSREKGVMWGGSDR
jgi:hypothetical protein